MEDTDSSVLLTPKHRQKWHYHLENVATYKLEFHLFKKQNSLIINGFFLNSLVFTSNILSLSREKESLLCSIVSSTPKWTSLCPVKELSLISTSLVIFSALCGSFCHFLQGTWTNLAVSLLLLAVQIYDPSV